MCLRNTSRRSRRSRERLVASLTAFALIENPIRLLVSSVVKTRNANGLALKDTPRR